MITAHELTVLICTHNRQEILSECLDSLIQCAEFPAASILIIDNNSHDNTKLFVQDLINQHRNIQYIFEPQIGLACARNTAIKLSMTPWSIFLDDDCIVENDFFANLLQSPYLKSFDMIGGVFLPWYKYGKPSWFLDSWVSNQYCQTTSGPFQQGIYACGGIWLLRTSIYQSVGPFNIQLGMSGSQIGYGEETDFQERALHLGYTAAFEPNWRMLHLVPRSKLTRKWAWKSHVSQAMYFRNKYNSWRIFRKSLRCIFEFARGVAQAKSGVTLQQLAWIWGLWKI